MCIDLAVTSVGCLDKISRERCEGKLDISGGNKRDVLRAVGLNSACLKMDEHSVFKSTKGGDQQLQP